MPKPKGHPHKGPPLPLFCRVNNCHSCGYKRLGRESSVQRKREPFTLLFNKYLRIFSVLSSMLSAKNAEVSRYGPHALELLTV